MELGELYSLGAVRANCGREELLLQSVAWSTERLVKEPSDDGKHIVI